jgi:hypothetical protein
MKGTTWFFHKKYGTSAETEAEKAAAQANMKIDSWTRERAAVLVTDTACAGLDVPLYSLSKARSLGTNCLAYHATRLGVAFATDVVKEVRQRNTLPSVPKGARDPISSTARNPPLAGGVLWAMTSFTDLAPPCVFWNMRFLSYTNKHAWEAKLDNVRAMVNNFGVVALSETHVNDKDTAEALFFQHVQGARKYYSSGMAFLVKDALAQNWRLDDTSTLEIISGVVFFFYL